MKKIISFALVLGTLLVAGAAQADTQFEITPVVAGGVRFGTSDLNNNASAYISGKAILLRNRDSQFNFLAPGVGFQTNGKLNVSIAPVVITYKPGWAFGVDVFPYSSNDGGYVGVFLGWEFY